MCKENPNLTANSNLNPGIAALAILTFVAIFTSTALSIVDIGLASAKSGDDATPPIVTNPDANPDTIPADGVTKSRLNVTVTDPESIVVSVIINLSLAGGSSTQVMIPTEGNVYSTTTTAKAGTAPSTYSLVVTATNIAGYSNSSVSIPLTVTAPATATPTPSPQVTPLPQTIAPTPSPTPPFQPIRMAIVMVIVVAIVAVAIIVAVAFVPRMRRRKKS